MQSKAESQQLLSAIILLIGSCQALLFTLTSVTFIQPIAVRNNLAINQLIPITAIGILLVASSILSPERVFPYLFYPAVGCYLFQLIYYTYLFRSEYNKSLAQLETYYDDEENDRLQWVKFCFYSALVIGILALFTLFLNYYFYCAFIIYLHSLLCLYGM